MNVVKDNFQAFLVEDARFVSKEEYPMIEKWMISEDPPQRIIPFNKINELKNIDECFICFYCRDEDFSRVKRNPRQYISLFKRSKGIIGFDFSIHTDMPMIKQKSQINDNLSLTYFYGKSGVNVIPNIRYGVEDTKTDFLQAIPKDSLIAFGTYGFIKTIEEQNVWFSVLLDMIKILRPKGIIVYGSLPSDLKNWIYLYGVQLYIYPSFKDTRMKEVKLNGN
ncbi:MAG: DUF4417 domain-containing protein [Acholeplasmataceae bacterium]|nr:DUF4417 domain-containing protein [Acholeplasmataceae bacterium]